MEANDFIKQRRQELNLTMLDVAKAVGVSESTVSRWESGNIANMRRDRIYALAKTLQVDPTVLLDEIDNTPTQQHRKFNIQFFAEAEKAPSENEALSEKDIKFVQWFRSLSPEKRQALLSLGDAPAELRED